MKVENELASEDPVGPCSGWENDSCFQAFQKCFLFLIVIVDSQGSQLQTSAFSISIQLKGRAKKELCSLQLRPSWPTLLESFRRAEFSAGGPSLTEGETTCRTDPITDTCLLYLGD